MKTVFVINNKSNRLAKILPILMSHSRENLADELDFLFTEKKYHAIELARKASNDGCDYLVAVGGDGTLNELINGVLTSGVEHENYPTIGLLPHGSANDFARSAGISKSINTLLELIKNECIQKIDLGKIVLDNGETRYFFNIAGLGLSPEVVQKIEASNSYFGPSFNYFKNIIQGFLSYKKKHIICSTKEWQWNGKLLQMAIANGKFFGNAICIAPDARLNDGKFQISLFGDLSIWDYLKNLGNLKKGKKIDHKDVNYYEAQSLRIDSNDSCAIEADGEYVGLLPAIISIESKKLNFLMP